MKKKSVGIFFCILIILAALGAGFYFGWTNFKLKPNQIGFVNSKTGGLNLTPVENGKFTWNWEFLIPTNAKLQIFDLKPYYFNKKVSGKLENSEIYKKAFNDQLVFDYEIQFDLKILVSKENIQELVKNNSVLNQTDLENYINNSVEKIYSLMTNYILEQKEQNYKFKTDSLTTFDILKITKIEESYPNLNYEILSIPNSILPDFQIYNKVRTEYINGLKYHEPTFIYSDKIVPGNNNAILEEILKKTINTTQNKE